MNSLISLQTMNIKKSWLIGIIFTLLSVTASQSFGKDVWDDTTTEKKFKNYRTSAWVDDFMGRYLRVWDDELAENPWLFLQLDQSAGGWDATIARDDDITVPIDKTPVGRMVQYKYDFSNLKGEGAWWMGAKVVVYSSKVWDPEVGLDGNYECYIVVNSNLTPEQLKERFGLEPAGESWHRGRKYKHYTDLLVLDREDLSGEIKIMQVWSILEDIPRKPSSTDKEFIPVGQIKQEWINNNLIEKPSSSWYPLGWMAFIETQGGNYGTLKDKGIGYFSELWLPFNGNNLNKK